MKNNEMQFAAPPPASAKGSLPPQLAQQTGFLLSWVAQASNAHYARTLEPFGFHPHHVGVLELVQAQQPVVQSRISEQLDIFKPVMVSLINDLENMELVQRRPHPTDGRAVEIHMLPKGTARLQQIREASAQASDAFFADLSAKQRALFHDLLAILAKSEKTEFQGKS